MVIVEKKGELPEAFNKTSDWAEYYGIPFKVEERVNRALLNTGAFRVPSENGPTTIYLAEAHPNL